ncbi:MAG: GGDEF domain-containing protein [Spirochaetota bacterium]|jgi:diguanylate cyclase (GGDEF)-like protein|nr:GGDEF domain-containing protein [Spirochaetota bacterium]
MRLSLNYWRFYGLGRNKYKKCMREIFTKNIASLLWTNAVVAILAACFAIYPIAIEKNFVKAGFYFGTAAIALLMYIFISYKNHQYKKGLPVSSRLIYTLIILYYVNAVQFGIYLGVWANSGGLAVSFMPILICALFLFNIPPALHMSLTLISMTIFIMASVCNKIHQEWLLDMTNALFAGALGLIFGWQIIRNRMSLASSVRRLKNERNKYYDQSTMDDLTGLKNRRDFMITFERYLSRHRESDHYLCLAIADIDFFKNYNDHYGLPQGDECLRALGKVLNDLHRSSNIYAARIGGEEFALLWFEKDAAHANDVAALVRQGIFNLQIPHEKSEAAEYVTVSIGIHIAPCNTPHDIHTLYDLADKALYAAKRGGRNRAVISAGE